MPQEDAYYRIAHISELQGGWWAAPPARGCTLCTPLFNTLFAWKRLYRDQWGLLRDRYELGVIDSFADFKVKFSVLQQFSKWLATR